MGPRELRAAILEKMVRRRQWGMSYRPVEQTLSGIPERFHQEAREELDRMVKEGWIEEHKNRSCVSLDPSRKKEIRSFLEMHGSMEDWLLDKIF